MASQMCALGQTGSALRCDRAFTQAPSVRCSQRFSRRHLVCRAAKVSQYLPMRVKILFYAIYRKKLKVADVGGRMYRT